MPRAAFSTAREVSTKLYRTHRGPVVQYHDHFYEIPDASWDSLLAREDVLAYLQSLIEARNSSPASVVAGLLPPVASQEVWAAGVTYLRSREARREESKSTGCGDFYDRVYDAERPELFFKSAGQRVVGPGGYVRIRRDSRWNVPEPELTLLIASTGRITGYTIGNDMSSRDIEGENPLYLPQAKMYDGACAIGPCILVTDAPLPPTTQIHIHITRAGRDIFAGTTEISRIKRSLVSLAEFLCRETTFPHGCFLLTGTGIVPDDSFTLHHGDQIAITIDSIGTLINTVA